MRSFGQKAVRLGGVCLGFEAVADVQRAMGFPGSLGFPSLKRGLLRFQEEAVYCKPDPSGVSRPHSNGLLTTIASTSNGPWFRILINPLEHNSKPHAKQGRILQIPFKKAMAHMTGCRKSLGQVQ